MLQKLKDLAARLKLQLRALHLAARDPRTPWYAKVLAAAVLAYALSPVDLIPDMLPVLGYLDDLVLVPLGIYLALRMIPSPVLADCRAKAAAAAEQLPHSRTAAAVVIAVWLLATILAGYCLLRLL